MQVWKSATAIDSFSIGHDLKRRRSDVKGILPREEHGTVWTRTDTLDAYAVFREDEADESEADSDEHDVCGVVPTTGGELR